MPWKGFRNILRTRAVAPHEQILDFPQYFQTQRLSTNLGYLLLWLYIPSKIGFISSMELLTTTISEEAFISLFCDTFLHFSTANKNACIMKYWKSKAYGHWNKKKHHWKKSSKKLNQRNKTDVTFNTFKKNNALTLEKHTDLLTTMRLLTQRLRVWFAAYTSHSDETLNQGQSLCITSLCWLDVKPSSINQSISLRHEALWHTYSKHCMVQKSRYFNGNITNSMLDYLAEHTVKHIMYTSIPLFPYFK